MPATTLPGGAVVTTFPALPHGFDLDKASDSDRAKFGIPRLPAGSDAEKQWRDLTKRLRFVEPSFTPRQRQRKELPHFKPGHGPETTSIWSGGITFPAKGDKIWDVNGTWNIPKATPPSGAKNGITYTASTWIGIDGDDGSGDVLQAGCDADVTPSGSGADYQFNPWWEWYPNPEVAITNFPVNPGDMITMLICSTQGAGSTSASVYFTNRTTGASISFTISPPSGYQLVGNCAEWIVEAPTVNGSQSAIADYGETFFSVCEAVTNSGATVSGGTGDNINLANGSTVLSEGVLITPTIVQCLYAGASP